MYYHSIAEASTRARFHYWVNFSKEKIITNVLGPFLRGQIIIVNYHGKKTLFNFKDTRYLRIFKTKKTLKEPQKKEFKNTRSIGTECTHELIKEIRFDKATQQAKSLMEKLMLPPKHQIFVIMKLKNEELDSVYKGVIRPLGEEFGYHVLRIDEIEDSGMITAQIIESIAESEIVLAELTGERPNCYYETGVAYATGRELILTIKEGEKTHFDLAVHRFIKWRTENHLRTQLRQRLKAIQAKK